MNFTNRCFYLNERTHAFVHVFNRVTRRKRWNLLRKQTIDVVKTDRQYKCTERVAQLCNRVSSIKFNNLFNCFCAFQSIENLKIKQLMKKRQGQLMNTNMVPFLQPFFVFRTIDFIKLRSKLIMFLDIYRLIPFFL